MHVVVKKKLILVWMRYWAGCINTLFFIIRFFTAGYYFPLS